MFCAFHRAQKQRNIILFRLIHLNVSDGSNKRVQMKLFKTMALIFVVFTLFWVPLFIVNCIALWSPATPVDINMTLFAVILTHACSFVNPIIYAVNQPSFRKVLRRYIPAFFLDDRRVSQTTDTETNPSERLKFTMISWLSSALKSSPHRS